jgi:pentatricopeptide repeat protein
MLLRTLGLLRVRCSSRSLTTVLERGSMHATVLPAAAQQLSSRAAPSVRPRRSFATRRAPPRGAFDRLHSLPKNTHFGAAIKALQRIENELHDSPGGPSKQEFRHLISEYGKVRPHGWKDACRVLYKTMPEDVRDTPHYNACIMACGRASKSKQALMLYEDMAANGIGMTVITFNVSISAISKGGNWKRALRVFKDMAAAGVQPDVITFNALISAMEKGGQWEQALRVFDDMAAAGECPVGFSHVPRDSSPGPACKVDLHGCVAPVAAAAVASVLRAFRTAAAEHGAEFQEVAAGCGGVAVGACVAAGAGTGAAADAEPRRLIIVTGRGLNSEQHLQPVLRPQICRLLDGLAPPLRWTFSDGNDGRVEVAASEIAAWCAASSDDWATHLTPLCDQVAVAV